MQPQGNLYSARGNFLEHLAAGRIGIGANEGWGESGAGAAAGVVGDFG